MALSAYLQSARNRLQVIQGYAFLFIFSHKDFTMYMVIYVDDIIIVSSSSEATENLIQELTWEFAVKDIGALERFLGIEVKPNQGVLLKQKRYCHTRF